MHAYGEYMQKRSIEDVLEEHAIHIQKKDDFIVGPRLERCQLAPEYGKSRPRKSET